jgi:quinolinate synthase
MKLNTLEKVFLTLASEENEITIDEEIRKKAEKSLNKMLELAI